MKKTWLLAAVAGTLLAAMMLGCVSAKPLVWDETLSDEESTTVYFTGRYTALAYNDTSLGKTVRNDGRYMDASAIKIPAGQTTFTGVAFFNIGCPAGWKSPFVPDWVYGHIPDVPLTYSFEAGKIYCVDFGSSIRFEEYEEEEHNMYFYIYEGVTFLGSNRPPLLAKIPVNIELDLPEEWKR